MQLENLEKIYNAQRELEVQLNQVKLASEERIQQKSQFVGNGDGTQKGR
jgi:hypothetical protein